VIKLVLACSSERNRFIASMLDKEKFESKIIDTITFKAPLSWKELDDAISSLYLFDWVILTSVTGAKLLVERAKDKNQEKYLRIARFAAVGIKTSKFLEKEGLNVKFVPSRYTTITLANELPGESGKVLLLRSEAASNEMSDILKARGFKVRTISLYRTVPSNKKILLERPDGIVFGSASEVRAFVSICKNLEEIKDAPCFCVGPVTSSEAVSAGFNRVVVPEEYTFDSLVKLLRRYFGC
jgi:uroporphyrinogen-III synthase